MIVSTIRALQKLGRVSTRTGLVVAKVKAGIGAVVVVVVADPGTGSAPHAVLGRIRLNSAVTAIAAASHINVRVVLPRSVRPRCRSDRRTSPFSIGGSAPRRIVPEERGEPNRVELTQPGDETPKQFHLPLPNAATGGIRHCGRGLTWTSEMSSRGMALMDCELGSFTFICTSDSPLALVPTKTSCTSPVTPVSELVTITVLFGD